MGSNTEKCKNCKYFKTYFHGKDDQTGNYVFSYVCVWTFQRNECINPNECGKGSENN